MTYKEFWNYIEKRLKKERKIDILKDLDLYMQKLFYYQQQAKKLPEKLIPSELMEKLK